MDNEIEKLVCDNCWRAVFSVEAFKAAWEAASSCESGIGSASESVQAGFTYKTPPWAEMQRSINYMCEWCDLLCEELLVYYRHVTKTDEPPSDHTFGVAVWFERRSVSSVRMRLSIENSWKPSWYVYTTSEDHAARYITERGVSDKLDSPTSYALALQCIRECESKHLRCPPPARARLPTRVIDCSDPALPYLFITEEAAPDYYVALSYVWGEDQPHRTTTSRLPSYIERIDTKYIPKTIRDAIQVTHTLGLRYLWVDAFCIIQDSNEDKAIEIAQIRTIFRHAYITIIAANANKVSDGFLNRFFLYNTPSTLPFRCPDGNVGTMRLQAGAHAPREAVNTRAWCLEERVLSTRALWYCSHTLQYECQTSHMNIDGSQNMGNPLDGLPRLPDRVFTPGHPTLERVSDADAEKEVNSAWQNVLQLYSRRALTKPRDRLLALSGVVEYFHGFWHRSRYIAGLWEHQLPGCLLWYTSRGNSVARPARYRAPSWSWAAVDGEISSLAVTYGEAVCTIKSCNAEPKWEVNPYGEVTAGMLVLDVILRRSIWDPVEGELFEVDGMPPGIQDDYRSERGEIGFVTVDAAEEVLKATCEVTAAVLVQTSTALLGILLVPATFDGAIAEEGSSNKMSTYRRVGWFTAPFCDRNIWLGTPRQVIRIV